MKIFHIGIVMTLAILFSACGAHYNNEPTQRLTDQQGHWVLLPGGERTTLIFDSVYKIESTWWQATQWAKEDGSYPWFWILAILGPVAAYAFYRVATLKQEAKPWVFLVILLIWGVLWVGAYCVLDSKRWSSDQLIPQTTYDSLMNKDGDLHAFWDKINPI